MTDRLQDQWDSCWGIAPNRLSDHPIILKQPSEQNQDFAADLGRETEDRNFLSIVTECA
jgi:hypothetical protein